MIKLDWQGLEGELGAMMARFNELPRYIAKKHLLAAIKRTGKDGVKVLKANTPKGPSRRTSSGTARGGALRRAATMRAKYRGRNRDGFAYGVLGFKYGTESRKAIWLEFGTKNIEPRRIVARTMEQWQAPAMSVLTQELAAAFDKAVAEVKAGINPGMSRKGMAAGLGRAR